MKYLPILQELFESDTFLFMILGIIIAVVAGLRMQERKKLVPAIMISVVSYGICEMVSHIRTNFMLELILLFVGTVSVGGCIGFMVCLFIRVLRRKD